MSEGTRVLLAQSLEERAARLRKFLGLKAPSSIVCAEVLLVWKAAFALYPEEMGRSFGAWVAAVGTGELGIYPECLKGMPHEMHVCEECVLKGGED